MYTRVKNFVRYKAGFQNLSKIQGELYLGNFIEELGKNIV